MVPFGALAAFGAKFSALFGLGRYSALYFGGIRLFWLNLTEEHEKAEG